MPVSPPFICNRVWRMNTRTAALLGALLSLSFALLDAQSSLAVKD
jgi:hypothetical protein